MKLIFEPGRPGDLDELEALYDAVNDHLAGSINYPGWARGVYPVRQTAADGIAENCLYVARHGGRIIATAILRHEPEPAYRAARWQVDCGDEEVFVIYTLAVHPDALGCGAGTALMERILAFCRENGARTVRLDVTQGNEPAIALYKKCGFRYIDTVDLGLGEYGLDWFELYERVL